MSNGTRQRPISIQRPVAVVVEGLDYFYFLLSQLDGNPEFDDIQLFDFNTLTTTRWLGQFVGLRGFSSVRALGIIRDAEGNADNTIVAIRDALANNSLPAADAPLTISKPASLATGYLVIPHGVASGCLEHACLAAATPDIRMDCVEQFGQCVNQPERNANWRAKVRVHAAIAGSSHPAQTLGQSGLSHLWDFAQPSLAVMIDFIRQLRDA